MKKQYLIYLLIFMFSQPLCSQPDTINNKPLALYRVSYGCLSENFKASYYFLKDTTLIDFFHQIDSIGFYEPLKQDTIGVLIDLLKKAEHDSTRVCLLPFYRVLDSNANEIYRNNCYVSPKVFSYSNYCSEVSVRYAMLFYLQFIIANPVMISEKEIVTKAKLFKKTGSTSSTFFTNQDYAKIYQKYYSWLDKGREYQNFYKYPLMGSPYSWELEIEQKGTGWYRKGNNYTPIKLD